MNNLSWIKELFAVLIHPYFIFITYVVIEAILTTFIPKIPTH